jgi:hypothetical protein
MTRVSALDSNVSSKYLSYGGIFRQVISLCRKRLTLVRASRKTVSCGRPGACRRATFVHFDQWSADATVADGTIKITHSLLARGQEAIPLSRIISFDREIDMTGGPAFTVTGPLQHPEVKATAEGVEN